MRPHRRAQRAPAPSPPPLFFSLRPLTVLNTSCELVAHRRWWTPPPAAAARQAAVVVDGAAASATRVRACGKRWDGGRGVRKEGGWHAVDRPRRGVLVPSASPLSLSHSLSLASYLGRDGGGPAAGRAGQVGQHGTISFSERGGAGEKERNEKWSAGLCCSCSFAHTRWSPPSSPGDPRPPAPPPPPARAPVGPHCASPARPPAPCARVQEDRVCASACARTRPAPLAARARPLFFSLPLPRRLPR